MNANNESKRWLNKIKEYLLLVIFCLASGLLLFYYIFKLFFSSFFESNINGFKELFGISLAILSSGIFLAVLKWFQFMGFFRIEIHKIFESSNFNEQLQKTLDEVVYSDEFLQKRNDLEGLWKRITRIYFKSEFPEEISDKVNKKLSSIFFHNNKISHFFRNQIITLNISLDGDDFLNIEEITEVKIIRPNDSEFVYDFHYYIEKVKEDDIISDISFVNLKIDGNEIDLKSIVVPNLTKNHLDKKALIPLKGKKEYYATSKILLKYNINIDKEYKFFSERIIDSLRTEINYSENLNLFFIPIGNEDFEERERTSKKLVKVYADMLLPESGFRLIFVKK